MLTHNSPPSFVAAELHGARRAGGLRMPPSAPPAWPSYSPASNAGLQVYWSLHPTPPKPASSLKAHQL